MDLTKRPKAMQAIAASAGVQHCVEVALRVQPGVISKILSELWDKEVGCAASRVYLVLEDMRGTYDAAVLRVYLKCSSQDGRNLESEAFLGSIGLYGLRNARLPGSDGLKSGLQCYLDITPPATKLERQALLAQAQLVLLIRPANKLPDGVEISIELMRIYIEPIENLSPKS